MKPFFRTIQGNKHKQKSSIIGRNYLIDLLSRRAIDLKVNDDMYIFFHELKCIYIHICNAE